MSGGGSKKVTVGYWYKLLYHFGLVRGPVDAFLEFRAGDRTAWKGSLTQSGRISINQPGLWGGEESEGGLQGDLDVMFGEVDQGANDYLAAQLGADQPTYRGKLTAVWRGGRWGAMNPYPKKAAMKVRRILKGWDNDEPWYPEKAEIGLIPGNPLAVYFALDMSTSMEDLTSNGRTRMQNMQSAVSDALRFIRDVAVPAAGRVDVALIGWGDAPSMYNSFSRQAVNAQAIEQLINWLNSQYPVFSTYFPAGLHAMQAFFAAAPEGATKLVFFITDGIPVQLGQTPIQIAEAAAAMVAAQPGVLVHGINIGLTDTTYTAYVDNTPEDGVPVIQDGNPTALTSAIVNALRGALIGMNPAHILYDSLVAKDMQGEPAAMINEASWRAAADVFHSEGFGLCTTYGDSEDIEAFQQRICDVVGACMSQSMVDGLYYLDPIRAPQDVAGLPVIGADDIVEFSYEPSVLTEQTNQVSVKWFDPQEKIERTTAPLQALGAIQAAGGVIPAMREYPEIAIESLALRVAERELRAVSTPTARFKLSVNRRRILRPGQLFRLQYPAEGIADTVCIAADIEGGTLTSGIVRMTALQDVYSFPDSTYVAVENGLSVPGEEVPTASPVQRAFEAPYIELVASLSRADLSALPADSGALLTAAIRPTFGLNYLISSAAEGEEFTSSNTGDWCPSAIIDDEVEPDATVFTFSSSIDLQGVVVGSWALLGNEIVRVDALDLVGSVIEVGRGCADTVPGRYDAGTRILFCGDYVGMDGREYVAGDLVRAKLLTRTSSDQLALEAALQMTVPMAQRMFRPYPPAGVLINGLSYPAAVLSGLELSWFHRDRLLQDDRLIDVSMGHIGPEPGTTYTARLRRADSGAVIETHTGVTGSSVAFSTAYAGDVIAEVWSVRDGLESFQLFQHLFTYGIATPGDAYTPQVLSVTPSSIGSAVTALSIQMPAVVNPGDLLVVSVARSNTSNLTWPAGWLITTAFGQTSNSRIDGRCKVADGTEGGTVLTVTSATAAVAAAVVHRIAAGTFEPSVSRVITWGVGSTASPTLPSLAPFWDPRNTLYVALMGYAGSAVVTEHPQPEQQVAAIAGAGSTRTTLATSAFAGTGTDLFELGSYELSAATPSVVAGLAIRGVFNPISPEMVRAGGSISNASVSSFTVNIGAAAVGDLIILAVVRSGSISVSASGWSSIANAMRFGALARVKQIGDPDTVTVTFAGSSVYSCQVHVVKAGSYDGMPGGALVSTGTSSTPTAPGVTGAPELAGRHNLVLAYYMHATPPSATPIGWPHPRQRQSAYTASSSGVMYGTCTGVVIGNVAGPSQFTLANSVAWVGVSILIAGPAPAS